MDAEQLEFPMWIRMDPKFNNWCFCKKWEIESQRQRRHTGKKVMSRLGRDWSHVDIRQGVSRIASNHQKLEEASKDSSLEPLEGVCL